MSPDERDAAMRPISLTRKTRMRIKKLHPDAIIPTYATAGAACFDLHAVDEGIVRHDGGAATFDTGLAFEVPEDHAMLVFSRSGHGFKKGLRLANCVGVIDSDYRGEVKIRLTNDSADPRLVKAGERVAQAMLVPILQVVEFTVVDELGETERGAGGFGSTGT